MKYCAHCEQMFEKDTELCPECKGQLIPLDENENGEIQLISVSGLEKDLVIQVLNENKVAYRLRPVKVEKYSSEMKRSQLTSFNVYIDVSDALKAKKLLNGINRNVVYQDIPNSELKKMMSYDEDVQNSSFKSRVAIMIMLLILITVAVFATDFVTAFLKQMFAQ